ncbi:MAG: hypothetical protein KGL39_21915 [Patescibacteria group bacterium]|nr:hypothetical protein [Patescibacteria group bacterium]
MKPLLREKAINLRRSGLSYSQILEQVPVARSTLSLWLRSVNLSKRSKQKLTAGRLAALKKGGESRRRQRISLTQKILSESIKEIGLISRRELWLIGAMLYWAEGTKEKDRHGSGVQFTNSDPQMIRVFLKWLSEMCKIPRERIYFDIFIHESKSADVDKIIDFWSKTTDFPKPAFSHVYIKRNKLSPRGKNSSTPYHGVIKVRVRESSVLTRKIAGWTMGVIEYLG